MAPLFPLVFAAVMGRLFYQISRWKLERGASLETLEQLMGSRTLGAAVMTHFHIKSYNLLTLALVFTWAFSPLGGQSLLQTLGRETRPINTTVTYYNSYDMRLSINEKLRNGPYYQAGLQSHPRVLAGPRDLWGNTKVPFLNPDAKRDDDGWAEVEVTSALNYTSFIGIAIVDVPVGNTTFPIESFYVQLDCAPLIERPDISNGTHITRDLIRLKPIPDLLADHFPTRKQWDSLGSLSNYTWYGTSWTQGEPGKSEFNEWAIGLDRFFDRAWYDPEYPEDMPDTYPMSLDSPFLSEFEGLPASETGPTKLLFQTMKNLYVSSECSVLQKYVESRVSCSRSTTDSQADCKVIAQRPSKQQRPSENVSLLNHPSIWNFVSTVLPKPTGDIGTDDVRGNMYLNYLFWNDPLDFNGELTGWPDLPEVKDGASGFGIRLSQMMNSFMMANYRGFTPSASDGPVEGTEDNWITIDSETTGVRYVYSISAPWVAASIASCLVLFIGGVLSVVFNHLNNGPELLGFVSTTLRDSRYIDTPTSMDGLDGAQVAVMMKKDRFRYGVYQSGVDGRMGIGREDDVVSIGGRQSLKAQSEESSSRGSFTGGSSQHLPGWV